LSVAEIAVASAPAPPAELGALVKRGLKWSFASALVLRFGTFFSGLLMARLLSPRDFGIYAVGAVALFVTASINDIGIEPTLVRWPDDLARIAPTAFTVVLAFSVVLFAGFYAVAPDFARAFNAPDGAGVVRLMSVGLIISGAFTVNSALANRSLRVHVRTSGEIAAMVVSIALTVGLAKAGFGAWSLAWGNIAGNLVVGLVLFIWAPMHCRPGFHWPTAKLLLRHGLPLAGAGLLVVASLETDSLMVGHLLGAVALGFYVLAWNISNWPVTLFSGAVNKVSVSGFAKLQHDPSELSRVFARSVGAVVAVTLPFCVLLAVLSLPAVRFLYGQRWSHSSTALAFLAAMAAIRVVTLISTDVLVAAGRGRTALGLQSIWLAALVPALFFGARWDGIQGVGVGHLVVAGMIVLPAFAWALHHHGFSLRLIGRSVAKPIAGGVCVAVVALAVRGLSIPDVARLALGGTLGLAAYLIVVRSLWMPWLQARRSRGRKVLA
jgi:PST family polysaccharide transporter